LAPQFAVTVRGYDRMQVEDYVDTLREWLGNATLRMEAAESENTELRGQVALLRTRLAQIDHQLSDGPPRTIAALGDRLARILELAEEGAAAARADAEAEAVAIMGRARQEAADLTRAAQGRHEEMEAFIAGAADEAARLVAQGEERAADNANRILAEAETRAAGREAQAAERARVMVADAEEQRRLVVACLEEEQAALRAELLRLVTERNEVRDGLSRLKESLHRTISELPSGAPPLLATSRPPDAPAEGPAA
jgi:cell division septum initiation protein DivIVA